jgi:hypothetical protein
MSLHKFAEQVAANGRGEDSLLVHMTPDEVRNLQKFAEANGTTLTINPETGLPEAGLLSDLFKAVAPLALGAFLGPAGAAFGGGLMSAGMAGLTVGGLTTLATGSLSRGLMAGLGAYGGAGLGESLMGAGSGALEAGAASAAQGQLGAAQLALGEALPEQAAQQFTKDAAARQLASASTFDKMGAGLGAITSSPSAMGSFAKDNLKYLGAAAAPIMAGAMVPTTTKMPENTNPAYIRQKLYDPYTQTYKSLAPVKASEFGNRSFSDAYTNPQTGQMDTLQPRTTSGFAGGGIVALANGGTPGYAPGGYVPSDTDIFNYFKTPGGKTDAQIAQDMQTYGVSAADIARATGTQGQQGNYEQRFVKAVATPATDAGEFMAAAKAVGLQNQGLATAMQGAGLSAADQYALTHNLSDATTNLGALKDTSFYKNLGYTTGTAPGDQGGLEGLYSNINNAASGLQKQINAGTLTVAEAQRLADAEMARVGVNQADIKGATGQDLFSLFKPKAVSTITGGTGNDTIVGGTGNDTIVVGDKTKKCEDGYHLSADGKTCIPNAPVIIDYKDCGTGYHWDKAQQLCVKNVDATQVTTTTVDKSTGLTTAPATALPVGVSGATGPSIFGGGATVNPNGTITTSPVIPGIPVGGFTGMEQVRDAYTKGGGSLGYTPYAPKTMAEFEQMYNRQTGDSLAAYDYLMGKGGGKYPVQSKAASTAEGIMRPYFAGGNRYKSRFLTAGKDGTVTESSTNPNAPKAGDAKAAELTKAKTIDITDDSGNNREVYTAVLQKDGTYLAGNGKRYDVTGKQLAAGGGMMSYAMGGGLGSLGSYSDGGRLLKGPGDGVSDSIPATIGRKQQPARLADGEFVVPARIVSELGNGSTDAGAKKLYAMMDRVQRARGKTTGKNKVAANSRADKYLPA